MSTPYIDAPKGTKIWIDTAPLIASAFPTGNVVEVELMHTVATGSRPLYICPKNSTPLYISETWVRPAP